MSLELQEPRAHRVVKLLLQNTCPYIDTASIRSRVPERGVGFLRATLARFYLELGGAD